MKNGRVLYNPLNGRFTSTSATMPCISYDVAKPQEGSSSEYNSNNAWNVNSSGTVNNNNKNNTNNTARGVVAYGGLFFSLYSIPKELRSDGRFLDFFKSVVIAYKDCMRGKKSSRQALDYMQIAFYDIPALAVELYTGTYKPSTSTCFLVKYPKWREVFAANFRDRIVHHWICLRLEPLFEYKFVSQGNLSFNCRKGFGTDKCVTSIAHGIKRVTRGYRKEAWIFKGDIVGFFMNINKELLWYLLERFITRWRYNSNRNGFEFYGLYDMPNMYWDILLMAVRTTVMHHPERNCILNSPVEWWHNLEPNKSLFTNDNGEPIGNLTTQLFANFFMSFFDSYVVALFEGHEYAYARFVDDWTIVCDDKAFLLASIDKMDAFLRKLRLEMHRDKRYFQQASHGVMFVGSFIKPNRIYLSNRTLARFEERVIGFSRLMRERELNALDCERIECVVNSYLGFCKNRRTYNRRKKIFALFDDNFNKYFVIRGDYKSIRTKQKYRNPTLTNAA